MYCLYCGWCCETMSPLGSPCPKLTTKGTFKFCSDYKNRPIECQNHSIPFRFCSIGLDVLKIDDIEVIRRRIDDGWKLIQELSV